MTSIEITSDIRKAIEQFQDARQSFESKVDLVAAIDEYPVTSELLAAHREMDQAQEHLNRVMLSLCTMVKVAVEYADKNQQ